MIFILFNAVVSAELIKYQKIGKGKLSRIEEFQGVVIVDEVLEISLGSNVSLNSRPVTCSNASEGGPGLSGPESWRGFDSKTKDFGGQY